MNGDDAFGLGIARILEAVGETGSIKAAAASVGKRYRHVGARIKETEVALGIALIETQVGGGGGQSFARGVLRWWKASDSCAQSGINLAETTCSNSAQRRLLFASFHGGGIHVALADDCVRFISENINVNTLRSLMTRAGSEVVGES